MRKFMVSINKGLASTLTLQCLVVTKRSHILSVQVQVCLSMCDLFFTTRQLRVNIHWKTEDLKKAKVRYQVFFKYKLNLHLRKQQENLLVLLIRNLARYYHITENTIKFWFINHHFWNIIPREHIIAVSKNSYSFRGNLYWRMGPKTIFYGI